MRCKWTYLALCLLLLGMSGCAKTADVPTETTAEEITLPREEDKDYVLNMGSMKFHLPECEYAANIQEENRVPYLGKRWLLIQDGFSPCKSCNP